jgi:hypothetical protein
MTVYGPHRDEDKQAFLQELRSVRTGRAGPWLICGYFNLVYKAEDKNNGHLNRCLMVAFWRCLQELELAELHLFRWHYTWNNERVCPTLERIDRMFTCLSWTDLSPHHNLRALSTSASDHAPLMLVTNVNSQIFRRFKFESIWLKLPGYLPVEAGWTCDVPNVDTFRRLDSVGTSSLRGGADMLPCHQFHPRHLEKGR